MKKKSLKPVAERISCFGNRTEIIYKCRNCSTSFAILGNHEHFCHNCGREVDWNVYISLKNPFSGDYEEEKRMIESVNQANELLEERKKDG